MTTRIPYDDLEPDMWVTIRDLPEEEEPPPFGDPFLEAMRMRLRRPSVVMQAGVPMRILAVDLPFLYLAVMNAEGTETGPLTLDLREQPVVGLDETVAHALRSFGWRKRQDRHERQEREARHAGEIEATAEVARVTHLRSEGIDNPNEDDDDEDGEGFEDRIRRIIDTDIEERLRRRRDERRRRPRGGFEDDQDED